MMEEMDISPTVTPRSSRSGDEKGITSDKDNTQSPNNREGAKSPENNCSICLGKFENKSFTDGCFHTFCFVCLQEWSKVKATCPLCKTPFRSIIHNIKSNEMYDQYYLPPTHNGSLGMATNDARFRYRSTLTEQRRQHLAHRRNWFLNRATRRSQRQRLQAAAFDRRRLVYAFGLSDGAPVTRARVRNVSAEFFRRNPACMHRLVPWLRREFEVLFTNNTDHAMFMTNLVMSYVPQVDMQSEEFQEYIRPFLYHRTEQFIQELIRFAQSPYDMRGYDTHVEYDYSQVNPRQQARIIQEDIPLISLSPDSSSSDSSQDQIPIVSNLLDIQPSTSSTIGVLPQPGTSSEQLSSSSSRLKKELSDTHNPEPPEINNNEESDISDGNDVMFVGYVKPTSQRTPEAVIVLSSDVEQKKNSVSTESKKKTKKSGRQRSSRRYKSRHDHDYHRSHSDSSERYWHSSSSSSRSRSRSSDRYRYRDRSSSYSNYSYSPRRDRHDKPGGKRKQKTKHVKQSSYRYSSRHYHRSSSRDSFLSTDSDASDRAYLSRHHSRSSYRYSRNHSRSRSPIRDYRHRTHHHGNDEHYFSSTSSSNFSKASTKTNSSKSKSHTSSMTEGSSSRSHSYYPELTSRSRRSRSRSDSSRHTSHSRSHRKSSSVEFMGAYENTGRRRNRNTYKLSISDSDIEVTHVKTSKKHKHRHKKHKRKHKEKHLKKKRTDQKEGTNSETQSTKTEKSPVKGNQDPISENTSPSSENNVVIEKFPDNTSPGNITPVNMEIEHQEPNTVGLIAPIQFSQVQGKGVGRQTQQTGNQSESGDKKIWTALDLLLQVERKRLKKLEDKDSTLEN
ncbi:uncharacterized protein LOC144436206 [Glandiceps talaboti]